MDTTERTKIQSLPGNQTCIDCDQPNPQWASVPFGTLFCLDCSGPHRGLGVHLDFVKSLVMDTWTDDQIRRLRYSGGNAAFVRYLTANDLATVDDEGRTVVRGGNGSSRGDIRAIYSNEVVQRYKEVVKARAERGDSATGGDGGNGEGYGSTIESEEAAALLKAEQIEDLRRSVRGDGPVPTVGDTFRPVLRFLSASIGTKLRLWEHSTKALVLALPSIAALLYYYPLRTLQSLAVLGSAVTSLVMGGTWWVSRSMVRNRLPAFKTAGNVLIERFGEGRALRRDGYDLYLPPPTNTNTNTNTTHNDPKQKKKTMGLIFYPGALVDHTAYAPILANLSDHNILVCAVSLEPTRFNTEPNLEVTWKNTLRIMYEVVAPPSSSSSSSSTDDNNGGTTSPPQEGYNVDEWALGGHSAGANVALELATKMAPGVSKLVLWAGGWGTHLSLRGTRIDVLCLQGTKDGITTLSEEKMREFRYRLPTRGTGTQTFVDVEGGNHAGFGHYGPQTFPREDGVRTITLEEQQRIVVENTAKFVLGVAL